MHIETITRSGKIFAVLPMRELQRIMHDAEMLADIRAYDRAKSRLKSGEDELIPLELIERRLGGKNPLKIWREYRGLTQDKLAKKSKVSRAMIAAIESGHKQGAVGTLKKLAKALEIDINQLIA